MYILVNRMTGEVLAQSVNPYEITSMIVRQFYLMSLYSLLVFGVAEGGYSESRDFIQAFPLYVSDPG